MNQENDLFPDNLPTVDETVTNDLLETPEVVKNTGFSTLNNAEKRDPQKSGMTHANWVAFSKWEMQERVISDARSHRPFNIGRNKQKRAAKAAKKAG